MNPDSEVVLTRWQLEQLLNKARTVGVEHHAGLHTDQQADGHIQRLLNQAPSVAVCPSCEHDERCHYEQGPQIICTHVRCTCVRVT